MFVENAYHFVEFKMDLKELFYSLPSAVRILLAIVLAVSGYLLLQGIRKISEWIIEPSRISGIPAKEIFAQRHPKIATVTSLIVSALTFSFFFLAIGFILLEMGVPLTAYLATASVVGLALAFGAQGLVQDVVIGLTLVFSHAFEIGDMIEVSGQIGRVEKVGLRFTTIVNLLGQTVYIPNRSINLVARYRNGAIRAYADIQIPKGVDEKEVVAIVDRVARGMREQFRAIIVTDAEIFGVFEAGEGNWKYLRIRFRLWPGQQGIIENVFRQRVIQEMKAMDPSYSDWMVAVTYKVE